MRDVSDAAAAIVGRDPELRAAVARAVRVAPTDAPVLVAGESGTGKELIARLLHERGAAPGGPFVAVNCGTLPRELADSELFGHERGAFTGAGTRRPGWFEQANGGTLVLDEIGELPRELQPKLLRVLEAGRIRRVGASGETPVRVRVVALTWRDLRGEAAGGGFRIDLFHRLAGFELALPPLRRRRGDIPLLAEHFLAEIAAELGRRRIAIDPAALERLIDHDWPGNVRELRNVLRRAAILGGERVGAGAVELPAPRARLSPAFGQALRLCDGDGDNGDGGRGGAEGPGDSGAGSCAGQDARPDVLRLEGRTFDEIERYVLGWALRRHGGSRRRAARALAIARSTFCDKVIRYGLGAPAAPPATAASVCTAESS